MRESRLALMTHSAASHRALLLGWVPAHVGAVQKRVRREGAERSEFEWRHVRPRASQLGTLCRALRRQFFARRPEHARRRNLLGERVSRAGFFRSGLGHDRAPLPRFDPAVERERGLARLREGVVREPLVPAPHRFDEFCAEVRAACVVPRA